MIFDHEVLKNRGFGGRKSTKNRVLEGLGGSWGGPGAMLAPKSNLSCKKPVRLTLVGSLVEAQKFTLC